MTPWEIKGRELVNCNCNFGCPCQFGILPNRGNCEAAIVYQIDTGHYGATAPAIGPPSGRSPCYQ